VSTTPSLKPREIEILRLIADGMRDRDIASRLAVSVETVRWYNKELYLKLGVSSRTQAVRRAAALGLLDLPAAGGSSSGPARRGTADATRRPSRGTIPAARSPIQYVERGGIHIAYQVVGSGPVDLVFFHGFISHLEIALENDEYAAFFEQLGRVARVILFDRRGVGLSDRTRSAPTLEESVGDAIAVLDTVRSRRAFVMGTSEGGAASLLLSLQHPDRARGLILLGATAKVARSGEEPSWAVPREEFDARVEVIQRTWGEPWAIARFAPSRMHDEAFKAWWSRVFRAASSPAAVRTIMEVARDVDVRALLPQVRVRTLVLHQRDDLVVPIAAGRFLAEQIPGARFTELPGGDHVFFVNGEGVVRAVADFLAEPDEMAATDTWLAIILHMTGRGAPLSAEQATIVEGCRPRHQRMSPMGWTALFDAPSRALACARRLRDLGRGRVQGISLHIGECRSTDGVAIGIAGEVVHQLASLAEAGEIVISDTLHDVLSGSGLSMERFYPRGLGSEASTPFGWRLGD